MFSRILTKMMDRVGEASLLCGLVHKLLEKDLKQKISVAKIKVYSSSCLSFEAKYVRIEYTKTNMAYQRAMHHKGLKPNDGQDVHAFPE
ncbi:hypothetical protein M8C21_022839, partial [Ambrosia artemisiifolia]